MRIFYRATSDTLAVFGRGWKTIFLAFVLLIFGSFLGFRFLGHERAMDELRILALYTFGPIGMVVPVVFLWNLWLAPYRLLKKRVEEIASDKGIAKPPEKADPKHWQTVELFELSAAACLWVGVEPHWPLYTPEAKGAYAELSGAFLLDKLPRQLNFGEQLSQVFSNDKTNLWVKPDQPVRRDSLIEYVRSTGKSLPEFLAINAESTKRNLRR